MLEEPESTEHPDLVAIARGDYCHDHKMLREEGRCEECILSKPAWKEPVPPPVGDKEPFNWTTLILWLTIVICGWAGICWYVGANN